LEFYTLQVNYDSLLFQISTSFEKHSNKRFFLAFLRILLCEVIKKAEEKYSKNLSFIYFFLHLIVTLINSVT